MPSLVAMAAFARVVESGSFTAAARDLELSTPVVSKRIGELEDELGTRLLHRTTRKLSLTEAGSAFYQHCARLVEEAKLAEEAVARLNEAPRGLLRVSAPTGFGSNQLSSVIPAFLKSYPEVRIEMILSDRVVDLAEEGFDLAIRLTNNPQSNLVARHLTTSSKLVCASPAYWREHGKPDTPSELAAHNCLQYATVPMRNEWHFSGPAGDVRVEVGGNLQVNGLAALRGAAIAGLGVIRLASFSLSQDIAEGKLETVLDDYASPNTSIYLVYLPNRYLTQKTRVFIEFLTQWSATHGF